MSKVLPNSQLDRKNILNNTVALKYLEDEIGFPGFQFEKQTRYTSKQVAQLFDIELRTVERYLSSYGDELRENGYEVISGSRLQQLKSKFGTDINVGTKTTILGLFNFRSVINMGMLLVESERARLLRKLILDIVIDVINKKSGGSTKYINQRDESYLISLYAGENYRTEFIKALKEYVEMGNYKYAIYINKIYQSIFKEQAQKYRQVLNLRKDESVRDTFYSEILTTISMYEAGLAGRIVQKATELKRKLTTIEVDELFTNLEQDPIWKPQIESVRRKMASRDYGLRSVMHPELEDYITPLDTEEFERFLGEKSMELAKRIEKYKEVFKRLKDK